MNVSLFVFILSIIQLLVISQGKIKAKFVFFMVTLEDVKKFFKLLESKYKLNFNIFNKKTSKLNKELMLDN